MLLTRVRWRFRSKFSVGPHQSTTNTLQAWPPKTSPHCAVPTASIVDHHLYLDATYHGIDLSETMVALARERLTEYKDRIQLTQSNGQTTLPAPDKSVDRVVSNYVLDILPDQEVQKFIKEAHRTLKPKGQLCLTSLTNGQTPFTKGITTITKYCLPSEILVAELK